jgi:N-methylhydantoinase A
MGLLSVGPRSAAAAPGPACYGRGGTEPTVTDANLLLGHLDAETFAGGTMKLSRDAAERSVDPLGEALQIKMEGVADGILAVVNENMASAARVHVAEGGHDATHYALLVTGGGGPLHGCDVARRLGISRIICPPSAGVASALGLLVSPARIDRVKSITRELRSIGAEDLEAMFAALERDAAKVMDETLGAGARYAFERSADIRFVGQGFEIVTRLPGGPFDAATLERIRAEFTASYLRIFAQVPPVDEIELINLRLAAIEEIDERPLMLDGKGNQAGKQVSAGVHVRRDAWNASGGAWRSLKVLARESLSAGQELVGPVIVEDASSTLVVPDGARATCDVSGNIIVELDG